MSLDGWRAMRLGIGAAALCLLAALPPEWLEAGPSLCPFRRLLGIECLGCGMTRALAWLMHGEMARAMDLHPLAPLAAGFALALAALELLTWQRRTRRSAKEVFDASPLTGMGNPGHTGHVRGVLPLPGRTELD